MEFLHLFSICWMATCIFIAIPLFKIIYNNIHNKPIVAITIIDLVYSDCILFFFCTCLMYVIGFSACLLSETSTLSFSLSLTLAVISYAALCNSFWSLTITGILRFISVIKNSEHSGIQSLGTDYVAIWKIRLISIALSSSMIIGGYLLFNTFPAPFYTLYYEETTVDTLYPSTFFKVFLVPIIMVTLVTLANAASKLYSIFLTPQLFPDNSERYGMYLEIALTVPFLMLLAVAFQFTTRMNRLLYLNPILVMFASNVFPMIVIAQNKSMRHLITKKYFETILLVRFPCKKRTTVAVTPAITVE